MKMIGCIYWIMIGLLFMMILNVIATETKEEQQLLDSLNLNDAERSKRPFCNAFTGCGKKRSYVENTVDQQGTEQATINIPISLYRALLRATTREIREALQRESQDDINSDFPLYSLTRKFPIRKRYQS